MNTSVNINKIDVSSNFEAVSLEAFGARIPEYSAKRKTNYKKSYLNKVESYDEWSSSSHGFKDVMTNDISSFTQAYKEWARSSFAPQIQSIHHPTQTANNTRDTTPIPCIRVPFKEEETQQGDGGPPLRVPESDKDNKTSIPVLTQESPAKQVPKNQSIAPLEQTAVTCQNTTGPAAKKEGEKSKGNEEETTERKNNIAKIAHIAYHGNAFNPNTQQIAQYFELSKCSKGYH